MLTPADVHAMAPCNAVVQYLPRNDDTALKLIYGDSVPRKPSPVAIALYLIKAGDRSVQYLSNASVL